jgi:chaperonin cofactor prefoldin
MSETQYLDRRLDRIEQQLDNIGKALERLAVIEDRQVYYDRKILRLEEKQDCLEECVTTLKEHSSGNTINLSWLERILWLIFTGAIGSLHLLH